MLKGFQITNGSFARVTLLTLALAMSFGCSNVSRKPASKSSPTPATSADTLNNPGAGDLFYVSNISKADGTTAVDVYSDGSTDLTDVCTTSSCTCTIQYIDKTDPGTPLTKTAIGVTLVTELYVRCPYNSITPAPGYESNVDHFTSVQIVHSSGQKTASGRVFAFGSATTTPRSPFVKDVTRFQCRDILTFQYELDRLYYDPFRSDAVELAQPLNFFSSNLARSFLAFTENQGAGRATIPSNGLPPQGWSCYRTANEPRFTTPGVFNSSVHKALIRAATDPVLGRFDYRIYSDGALQGHSFHYPPLKNRFEHFKFSVSRSETVIGGVVFNQPIAARTYPRMSSTGSATNSNPLIGYGAAPTQNGCPALNLPGYRMVKLWALETEMPKRQYPSSPELRAMNTSGQPTVMSVGCVPTETQAFESVVNLGSNGQPQNPALLGNCQNLNPQTPTVRRDTLDKIQSGERAARLWMFDTAGGGGQIQNRFCSRTPATTQSTDPAYTASGLDVIQPMNLNRWRFDARVSTYDRCHSEFDKTIEDGVNFDYDYDLSSRFKLCPGVAHPLPFPTPPDPYLEPVTVTPGLTPSSAKTAELAPEWLEYDANSRQDYLFLATEPTVTYNDLSAPEYRFFRFASPSFCTPGVTDGSSHNLLAPTESGTCAQNYRVYYRAKTTSIADPNQEQFPLCVLQKVEGT